MTQFSDYKMVGDVDGNGTLGLQQVSRKCFEFIDVEIAANYSEREAILRVTLCSSNDSNLHELPYEEIAAVRDGMQKWLDEYMTLCVDVDFSDVLRGRETFISVLKRSAPMLIKRHDTLLNGDFTPLAARWHLSWTRGDAFISGGDYGSLEDAERAAFTFEAELRDMCCEDWQLDKHNAGEMQIRLLTADNDFTDYSKTIPVRDMVGTETIAA